MGIAADFVLIVVAGLVGALLARALRLPLLVGYVVAGVFVGPHTSGPTVGQVHDIETLAEIGVALLLFSIGLEVSFRDLHVVRRISLIGGPIQVLVTIGAAAVPAAYLLGFDWAESIWFGAMISVSSTMVVLKVVAASGLSSTLASRVMIALLLVQDLAVIPMLIILPLLGSPENLLARVAGGLAAAGVALAVVFVAGTRLLPPLFHRILFWGSRELFLVAVVATGVGIGAAAHAAGFSFALGAFVAGLILSESEFSHQALSDIIPLRDIFGLLFFVTVGMLFDPAYALEHGGLIALVVVAVIAGKALIFGGISRAFGYRYMAPWIVAFGLAQVGEFSFVLARAALQGEFVRKSVYDLVLTATVVTMALSPMVSAAALPLGRAWQRRFGTAIVPPPVEANGLAGAGGHVVVGGYGRTGKAVAGALRAAGIKCLIVESNYSIAADFRDAGFDGLWGDITRDEILHAVQIGQARMLLLTMPEKGAVGLTVDRSRRLNPGLMVVARSTSGKDLQRLLKLDVVPVQTEFEGGLEMVRQALVRCDRSDDEVAQIVDELRTEIYQIKA